MAYFCANLEVSYTASRALQKGSYGQKYMAKLHFGECNKMKVALNGFTNSSTHKALFNSNMITNCRRDIYKEFFFHGNFLSYLSAVPFPGGSQLESFFASVVLFLASTFGNLWRKKSIIISLSFFLGILNSKQMLQAFLFSFLL